MSKRIIVCLQGTWNKPRHVSDPKCSNICRFIHAIDSGRDQYCYISAGIGGLTVGAVSKALLKHIGGVTGLGISRLIFDAYQFLVDVYAPGDTVYLFGFSRGALAARSLAGMINACGVLRKDLPFPANAAFQSYRTGDEQDQRKLFERHSHGPCSIEMLGLWDTVSALGLPINWLEKLNPLSSHYHQVELNPSVRAAYHALAIDENRKAFLPTLFDERLRQPGQVLEQVWFAGCHTDVGGGYHQRGLADISLAWMIKNAERHGVSFKPDAFRLENRAFADKLHNPRKGLRRVFIPAVRPIDLAKTTTVSSTVQQRANDSNLIPKYVPRNIRQPKHLDRYYTVVNPFL